MFLIGFGICALLAVALLYWRWSAWSGSKQAFDQVATERNRLEHLDPFPNDANYGKLQDYVEKYNVTLDKFKEALKTEVVPAPAGMVVVNSSNPSSNLSGNFTLFVRALSSVAMVTRRKRD